MSETNNRTRVAILHLDMTEFWSGDVGLTLVSIALVILIFVITPMREAGLPGRIFFDAIVVTLMISGALSMKQGRWTAVAVVTIAVISAAVLIAGRLHPSPSLRMVGSVLSTITLLLYVWVVLLVMFRSGPVTWSRIQGGICAYLLLGMAWASAYAMVEQAIPGAFSFVARPADMDQLTAKLTYYSFAVLTTVGSDISPVHPFARSLTIAESVVGQLYPALLIGSLVALAMQARPKE
jgi:hypothetical protein